MAKKPKTPKKKAAKAAAGSKTVGKKKSAAKNGPLTSIDAMTPAQRKAVFRAVQTTLSQHRVKGALITMHFDTDITPLLCTPPKVRRMVCRLVSGVPVCGPECVDP